MTGQTRAFTLSELVVSISAVALMFLGAAPSLVTCSAGTSVKGTPDRLAFPFFRERARRAVCAANLNAVGKALLIYAVENDDRYPFIQECDNNPTDAKAGGAEKVHELMDEKHDNMLENLNLLVPPYLPSYGVLRCPSVSTETAARQGANKKYGFYCYPAGDKTKGPQWYIDYGYHLGYRSGKAPFAKVDAGFAVMADADVGNKKKADEGWNHETDGANVLAIDGAVSWNKPTADGYVIANGDNIYTNGGAADDKGEADAPPVGMKDQVLYSPK